MTGFGRTRKTTPEGAAEASLSSINKRGQEIFVNLPREFAGLEGEINELIKEAFERGKLQLTVRVETKKTKSSTGLEKRVAELKAHCKKLGVRFDPNASLIYNLMKETSNESAPSAQLEKTITLAVKGAIVACQKAQAQEGARLQKDFEARLKTIDELRTEAEKLAPQSLPLQKERLIKNLAQSGLALDSNDERLLKELALFADRVDIAEELTRIKSHLTAMKKLIAGNGGIGRQMEFLIQELLREWNTLGNKSPQIELIKLALSAKNEIERMKEQAANIA